MRLTQILLKWPRSRPNGNIWIGKDKMVRLVKPKDLNKMEKQIAMVSQWQTALKTVETINKIPISGEEECLRMSEPLHLTGGGEDSHGGQGEHRTEAWSTPVQVNCMLTIKWLYAKYYTKYSFSSGWGRKEPRLLPWRQPLLKITSGIWHTMSPGKSEYLKWNKNQSNLEVARFIQKVPRPPPGAKAKLL